MKLYKPQIDQHEKLKKEIVSWGDKLNAADSPVIACGKHQVQLSPKKNKSWITDQAAVFKALGEKLFISLSTITLEAVRSHNLHDLIETDRIGSREIVSIIEL